MPILCHNIYINIIIFQNVRVAVRDDLAEVEKLYAEFNQVNAPAML